MLIKTVSDYYEDMYSKFPEVPKEDIKRILNYGWKVLYLYNSAGADVIIKDSSFWCYIGFLKNNSIEYFSYYIKKLAIKLRILYKRKKVKWDGYYYFALNDSLYEDYIKLLNKRGRKRKWLTFNNIFLYKILEECKIREASSKYIFRIPYITDIGYKRVLSELKTDKAELIITRDPLKFKDILVSDNDYELI